MIEKHFARMGARLKIEDHPRDGFDLDIQTDKKGEYFLIRRPSDGSVRLQAVEVKPEMRHLLLHVNNPNGWRTDKFHFLCGHDERHWFAAAVPSRGVNGVMAAMESLRPEDVDQELNKKGVRNKNRHKRHNKAYRRQGEWFFMSRPDAPVEGLVVYSKEKLQRNGGSKPHIVDELVRYGGFAVYVCPQHPEPLTPTEKAHFVRANPEAKKWSWEYRRANPAMFVRGNVRHPDHATIFLPGWHEVQINNEPNAGSSLRFID